MSQGKRAPAGTCDYCMTNPAHRTLGDKSEACQPCLAKMNFQRVVRGSKPIPTIGHLRQKRNFASEKYAPCGCGCGKKAKFCDRPRAPLRD